MQNKRVLISGAGIAGATLAFWLKKYGFEPTIVEIAPQLRTGGYMIDFWGAGFRVAEKMGIIDEIEKRYYAIPELDFVNADGKVISTLKVDRMRKAVNYRHFNLNRGDLAAAIWESLPQGITTLFGESIASYEEHADGITVTLSSGQTIETDLLIGADGLHSNVRQLMYHKDENAYEHFLGYYLASYTLDNYQGREHFYESYSEAGKQIGYYARKDGRLAAFFMYASERTQYDFRDKEAQKNMLRDAFKDIPWAPCHELLSRIDSSPDFYFDEATQIQLDTWHKGRAALVGDAAQCVSLLSGQGSGLAMAGAYILAGELSKYNGDFTQAFPAYQALMQPEIERKQKKAQKFAGTFIPKTSFGVWLRNTLANIFFLPGIRLIFVHAFLADKLTLPEYQDPQAP